MEEVETLHNAVLDIVTEGFKTLGLTWQEEDKTWIAVKEAIRRSIAEEKRLRTVEHDYRVSH